jgi:hypothetical protein
MRRLDRMRAIPIAMALSAMSLSPAAAQDKQESGPTLEVHVRSLRRTGGVTQTMSLTGWLVPGTPVTWHVAAGTSNPAEMTVCGGGVSEMGTLADKLARSAFMWEVKMLPSKYENGTVTVDLEWARYQNDGSGRPVAEGKNTLTLREGDRHQIDFVRGVPGARNCDEESAVIEVGTGYKENRRLAQTVLQYDLWLKHQQANGEIVTRRFTGMGMQGADVNFFFAPLQFALRQLTPEQTTRDVFTTVKGTIRGRLLPNGRIAIIVDTSRRDGVALPSGGPGGGSGNSGRKLLDAAADEAIEIELPASGNSRTPVRARVGVAPTPPGATPSAAPKQAVSLVDGWVVVDNALFFQGQRTSLIMQVKPVR